MWWWNRIGSWGWQLIPFPWRMVTFWSSETWTSSTGLGIKGQTSQLQSEPDSFIGSNPKNWCVLCFWIHQLNPHDLSFIEIHGLGMARYGQIWMFKTYTPNPRWWLRNLQGRQRHDQTRAHHHETYHRAELWPQMGISVVATTRKFGNSGC